MPNVSAFTLSAETGNFPALTAPSAWQCVDFISDIHLSPAMPRTAAVWQRYLQTTTADALFVLGDLWEAWIGDDLLDWQTSGTATKTAARHHDLDTYAKFARDCVATLAETAHRLPIWVMHGNRDFLLGEHFAKLANVQRLSEPAVLRAFGIQYVLCHGDAQCWDDRKYMTARAHVRNPAWQSAVLARPLQERLALAQTLREDKLGGSSTSQSDHSDCNNVLPCPFIDLNADAVQQLLHKAKASTLIHGHTHRPAKHDLRSGQNRWVLSDWDVESNDALQHRASVLRLTATGLYHLSLVPN